ncbi:MAG TPA: hypothetical protein VM914_07460 [Pyrinomonadaceae bacterium]|jgi:hypothetical protein|nr:hypothetical protein [Pyrinomonadaceae bacterium]
MSDINEFVKKLGDDIGTTFAPRVEQQVVQTGNQIADRAAPKVQAFVDQLVKDFAATATPKVRDFSNQLVKDIFMSQSGPLRDFVIKMVQDLIARYEPVLAGNVHTKVVNQGLQLSSNDTRIEIKERATGKAIASLDLPVDFRIDFKEMTFELDKATLSVTTL